MQKIKWRKPNGSIIETNGEKASIETAVALGWELVEQDGAEKPKRGRPPKGE